MKILGVKVDKTTKDEVLQKAAAFLIAKKKFSVVTPNPEIILSAQDNPHLKKVLNSADISVPDGVGLKLANPSLKIIKGRDLMVDLTSLAYKNKLKIFFLGASESVNAMVLEYIRNKYPGIMVAGVSGPELDSMAEPINSKEKQSELAAVSSINKFAPDILFVAFGAPKQELWLDTWHGKINSRGVMVVGGSLDYLVGGKVPLVFSKFGFEWLWRLIKQPSRIGRIMNAVIVFPLVLLKSRLSN